MHAVTLGHDHEGYRCVPCQADGFVARVTAGYRESVPLLRRAIAVLGTGELSPQQGLSQLVLGCVAAAELFDDQAQHVLAIRLVELARDHGALTVLPVALNNQIAFAEVFVWCVLGGPMVHL
jgi:hypothetical protein